MSANNASGFSSSNAVNLSGPYWDPYGVEYTDYLEMHKKELHEELDKMNELERRQTYENEQEKHHLLEQRRVLLQKTLSLQSELRHAKADAIKWRSKFDWSEVQLGQVIEQIKTTNSLIKQSKSAFSKAELKWSEQKNELGRLKEESMVLRDELKILEIGRADKEKYLFELQKQMEEGSRNLVDSKRKIAYNSRCLAELNGSCEALREKLLHLNAIEGIASMRPVWEKTVKKLQSDKWSVAQQLREVEQLTVENNIQNMRKMSAIQKRLELMLEFGSETVIGEKLGEDVSLDDLDAFDQQQQSTLDAITVFTHQSMLSNLWCFNRPFSFDPLLRFPQLFITGSARLCTKLLFYT